MCLWKVLVEIFLQSHRCGCACWHPPPPCFRRKPARKIRPHGVCLYCVLYYTVRRFDGVHLHLLVYSYRPVLLTGTVRSAVRSFEVLTALSFSDQTNSEGFSDIYSSGHSTWKQATRHIHECCNILIFQFCGQIASVFADRSLPKLIPGTVGNT